MNTFTAGIWSRHLTSTLMLLRYLIFVFCVRFFFLFFHFRFVFAYNTAHSIHVLLAILTMKTHKLHTTTIKNCHYRGVNVLTFCVLFFFFGVVFFHIIIVFVVNFIKKKTIFYLFFFNIYMPFVMCILYLVLK